MTGQEVSVRIERPADDVFAYLDDVSREHEWQPTLESAEKEPDGPTTVGTRKRYASRFIGRTIENTYVVTALDPGRRIVYETTDGSAIDARSEIICEPVDGGTRVTMMLEARPKGMLRLVPQSVLEAAYRDQLDQTLKRLKERLESAP